MPDAHWQIRLTGRITGERLEPRFMDSPLQLEAFQVADLYIGYALKGGLRLFFDLRNVTNQRYFEVAGFNARGRNFMTGLSYSF
ncbi:MAG: TonB-dependent receptor [Chitinophagaceae bacterium]|nr:TonB-dependent receptor [Chitinophagaceae bacterium]